jgi:(4-O-methyl)-D-glucuronate---lignin esterase
MEKRRSSGFLIQGLLAFENKDSLTTVSITLPEYGSAFVVFDKQSLNSLYSANPSAEIKSVLTTLNGPWELDFPAHWGAPDSIILDHLQSWTESSDSGVKYFSGIVTYNKNISVPAGWFNQEIKLMLDLGQVMDIAEVSVNGKLLGIRWKPPYHFDITKYLKQGSNQLAIKVTNQWTNRLLGDRNPQVKKKVLPAESEKIRFFGKPPALPTSGLLGPVTIFSLLTHE